MGTQSPRPLSELTAQRRTEAEKADSVMYGHQEAQETCRAQMSWVQAVQKEFADHHRIPAPALKVGDWVMLSTSQGMMVVDSFCARMVPSQALRGLRLSPTLIEVPFNGLYENLTPASSPETVASLSCLHLLHP
ncbi:hypothetical protein EJ06DRAFT_268889 [Trichodelitschia bisporula]|uniref:Uncharacterized protein n=1 Tax=Trichodelitschia bisporula TaxID=703511 RepID=A0A6G1HIA8_9PEZI|nr:hypothetical protein EJ06DRAFT_268889 [Trichodelitschia bisporula]